MKLGTLKLGTLSRIRKFFGLATETQRKARRKSIFRSVLMESLEKREVFAAGDLLVSEIFTNPSGNDSPFEFVELVATRPINFASTPYSVVFANNGTATSAGWIAGGAATYGFNINTGSVAAGDVVYVGGSSMTPTGTKLRTINTGTTAGDGFGSSNASGVLGNGGTSADAVGVFDVAIGSLTNSSVPIDAIFFGSAIGSALVSNGSAGYQLPVNDKYTGGKLQSTSFLAPDPGQGQVIVATGTYDVASNTYSTVRVFATGSSTDKTSAITLTGLNGPTIGVTNTITDASKSEGNTGTTSYTFTVSRSIGTGTASVNWAITGTGANPANAADFGGTFPSGTVNFATNESTIDVTVNVTGDTLVEPDENFVFTLSGASSGYSASPASASAVILNDDSSFSIAALSANKAEGDTGTTPFTFTVTRSGNLTQGATVDYSTLGSGANPTDALDLSGAGTVTFAANQATATVTINVVGDTNTEQNETFDVTLANAVSVDTNISANVGAPASATGTILNDDAATQLAIAATSANKAEGNSATTPFTFTVTRSGDLTGPSTATWTVTGSGTNPASTTTDISGALTGTVSFAAGETAQAITVNVIGDTAIEPDEGFTVTLSNPSAGVAITANAADGVIVNDDVSVSLPTNAITTTEGNTGPTTVSVTVTRSGDTSVETTVAWAITGTGTNPVNAADFVGGVLPSGTLTFAIGQTQKTINFDIQGDTNVELNETYTLTLSNASGGAVIGTATEAGTITNDDVTILSPGDIAFTGYNGTTSTEQVSFVVLRDIPSLTAINFTDNGYTASNGQFNSNENLVAVVFTADVSAGTRFYLEGTSLKLFGGAAASATVTGSALQLSNTGDQVTALQGNINAPTSILASISSSGFLTGTGAINNNTSYLPAGLTLGTTAISLGDGTFNGVLNSADADIGTTVSGSKASILSKINDIANWTASTSTALVVPPAITFTVTPDTPVLSIAANSATAAEGNSGTTSFTFTVTRSAITTGTTTVDYTITGGTADAADFGGSLPTGTITFNDGDTSRTITINVSGDNIVEPNETFTVTLSNASSPAVITTASAIGTIQNDDSSFSISAASASKLEGNSGTTPFTFTITRSGNLTDSATVDYAASGSGANPTDASDFSDSAIGTATFAAGVATATITINVAGDATVESDETFSVALSNAVVTGTGTTSASVGTPASATGTILNDDAQTLHSITATDAIKAEGNSGTTSFTFTVSRTGDLTNSSSVTWTVTGSGTNPADTTTDLTAPLTGTVSFDIGESSKDITVLVNGDTLVEPSEGFSVTLSNPTAGTAISTATAVGSIVNDDIQVAIPTTPISNVEGNSGSTVVNVTVTRTGDTSVETTVAWSIVGSGANPATADDFLNGVLPSGTVVFATGETTKTISFSIAGDTTIESNEGYTLSLDSTSNGLLGNATEVGTITNDDIFMLQPGDLAFTGYNGTTTIERVSFVVLRDIPAQTTILFTDNGYTVSGNSGSFNTNEGLTTVLFNSTVPAGTRFYLEGLALKNFDGTAAAATVTGTPSALSNSGDQVTALQGTLSAPLSILASISSGSYLTTGSINNSTSYLPTGLTLGTSAISLGNGTFNGVLNSADSDIGSSVNGTQSAILSKVNDVSNWVASTATNLTVPPAITFNFGLVTPTVSVPSSVTYSAAPVALTATADDGTGGYSPDTDQSHFTFAYFDGPMGTGNAISAPTKVGSYSVVVGYAGAAGTYNSVPSTAINFSITPFALTPTATATSKTYDATDAASVSISLAGIFAGDTVSGSATGTFDTKNVGAGKTVTVGAITLTGSSASNYSVASAGPALADISAYALTASGTASSKVYDATTSAAVSISLAGVFGGDTVVGSAVGTFSDKNVGTGKSVSIGTVTLSGADASNYTVGSAGTATADITKFALSATATGTDKVYDATAATTVAIQVVGAFAGDVVSATGTATFGNKNVAIDKTVTVNSVTLAGADAANYSLAAGFTTTATISQASLSVTGLTGNNRAFDGTTVATVSGVATISPIGTDLVVLGGSPTYLFANVGPGSNIAITASGFTISGGDSGNYDLQQPTGLSATITANVAPSISAQSFTINSKSLTDAVVGNVVATDADAGQTLSYAITGGNSQGAFKIDTAGKIQVADATKLPVPPKGSTSTNVVLTVSVTDSGIPAETSSAPITVIVSTTGRNAPFVAPASFSLAENNKKLDGSTKVGAIKPTASYTGQKFANFSLGGDDAKFFAIDSAKGTISLAKDVSLNYEAKSVYDKLSVSVTDSVDTNKVTTAPITVTVTNVNEAPVFSLTDRSNNPVDITGGKGTLTVDENIPTNLVKNGYIIGKLTTVDQDELASTLNYQKDGKGADVVLDKTGAFGFNPTTGEISVVNESKVNFESSKSIKLSFIVTDNPVSGDPKAVVLSTKLMVTVNLNDLNEAPVFDAKSPTTLSVAENNKAGVVIGQVKVKDADSKAATKQTLTYSIQSIKDEHGDDAAVFAIDSATGKISVPVAGAINYEASKSYTLVVRVTDNGSPSLYTEQTITVTVTDVNEAASLVLKNGSNALVTGLSLSKASLSSGVPVGKIEVSDVDAGTAGSNTLTFTDGSKGGLVYNSSTGVLSIGDTSKLVAGKTYKMSLLAVDGSAKAVKSTLKFDLVITL